MSTETKSKRGRPTKLTEEMAQKIMDALSVGFSVKRACKTHRICRQSFYNWCKHNPAFLDISTRAKALGELELLYAIKRAALHGGDHDWRAAEALLKLMYPARYAKHVVNHEGRALPGDTFEDITTGELAATFDDGANATKRLRPIEAG